MLSVSKYSKHYVDECRAKIDLQMSVYDGLLAAVGAGSPPDDAGLGAASAAFEPLFFNHMLLALEMYFCHRARTMELKDGNPLNEMRVLCNALMSNDGIMTADKTIKMKAPQSLLGYEDGDRIALTAADFRLLSNAVFAEIEMKYP